MTQCDRRYSVKCLGKRVRSPLAMSRLVALTLPLALGGLLLLTTRAPAVMAKGCQPTCRVAGIDRIVLDVEEEATVWAAWVDSDGKPVEPPVGQAALDYSVFFWQVDASPGDGPPWLLASTATLVDDSLSQQGQRWQERLWRVVVRDAPQVETRLGPTSVSALEGRVTFPVEGVWIGQLRPSGAWPRTPWGSGLLVLRVLADTSVESCRGQLLVTDQPSAC